MTDVTRRYMFDLRLPRSTLKKVTLLIDEHGLCYFQAG